MFGKNKIAILLGALSLIAAVAGLPWISAQGASEPAGFKAVLVWINPEYDDPRVLTMIEGQITGATPPVTIRFLVPSTAEMYSAGSKDASGKYTGGPPNRVASGISGWDEISYTLTTNTFRVEYYDDSITGLPNKAISYNFRTLYPISDMVVWVQEPKNSTNFLVVPKEQSVIKDNDGLTVHRYSFTNVATDPATHFDISYTKADSKPSLGQNTSAAPSAGSTGSGSSVTMWLAVGLAGILAIALIYAVTRRGSGRRPAPAPARTRAERPLTAAQRASLKQSVGKKQGTGKQFCTECGNKVEGSPKFCPECGAKL
ncbi:MAG: hypothetical protein Q7T05_03135 [Dehalococcoidia bacterium]|nr:hypothetical protein [Dehalococcoidia bacterium]